MKKSYLITFFMSVFLMFLAFSFQEKLSQFKAFGLLGIFLINFFGSATLFLPAPAIASVLAGGIIYPPIAVAIVSAFGASFGDMLGFFLGYSGKQIFLKNNHKWYGLIKNVFQKYGGIIIFLFAFIPNPLFDGVGILAGTFLYPMRKFFIFLFAGRLLRNIFLAYLGHAVGR